MNTISNEEILQSLRTHFPKHMPRMEEATTQEEFVAIHSELMSELRQNLRNALAEANIPEDDYSALLQNTGDGNALSAIVIEATKYEEVTNAKNDKVKEFVQWLFNGLETVGKSSPSDRNELIAARLIVNRLIATGEKGIRAADNKLKEYVNMSDTERAQIENTLKDVLDMLSEEEREILTSGAFVGATAAAVAGVALGGGGPVVIAIILIIVAVLIPILVFMIFEAACVILVVNGIDDNDLDYEKFKLVHDSSYNIHGKETGYTPEILSAIKIDEYKFAAGGFYTTEKRSAALYGTNYGVKFKISDTNITVAFGVECPLNGDNKCFCDFNISAEDAADKVRNKLECESSYGGYKAKIHMNSTSGRASYYITTVYK